MRVLITNDDGIDAIGISALIKAVEKTCDVTIVAPMKPMSECSHTITTRNPIRVEKIADNQFSVDGSPADCVRLGLRGISELKDCQFDWVLSGINQGGNLGVDRYLSGTVAGAREGTFLGVKSVAVSHYLKRSKSVDWDMASSWFSQIWDKLVQSPPLDLHFFNINFPHLESGSGLPELVECQSDNLPLDIHFDQDGNGAYKYSGSYPDRLKHPGKDTDICFNGSISLSQIPL